MKQYRSPPNNYDGIFPVSFSYVLLSFSYRSPIILLSFSYRSPIVLLSFSYHSPIVLLSFSYLERENNTETIRNGTKDERRMNE